VQIASLTSAILVLDQFVGDVPTTATNQITNAMKLHQFLIAAALPFAFASCGEKVEKTTEEVKASAAEVVDKAKDAAVAEVDKAKDAATAEIDKATDAAAAEVDKVKDAAADTLQDAADKLKTE
jgi:F0F1-type ATP synthase membrane subunit b/b'